MVRYRQNQVLALKSSFKYILLLQLDHIKTHSAKILWLFDFGKINFGFIENWGVCVWYEILNTAEWNAVEIFLCIETVLSIQLYNYTIEEDAWEL